MSQLEERYAIINERIAQAAQRAGRSAADITLVAVTKTWPAELAVAAYEAGMRHLGENRAEELAAKRSASAEMLGNAEDLHWHQIGALQSRKTGLVADHADVFQALDRMKIAQRLSKQLQENGRVLPTFLEVNISGEASKSGIDCFRWEEDATQRHNLRNEIEQILALPGIQLQGLMTMAPWGAPEAEIRTLFRRTRELAKWLQTRCPQADLTKLSMGMSDDFEIGIEEGATHVRVGRALFGSRH